jgi:hypothetical protein
MTPVTGIRVSATLAYDPPGTMPLQKCLKHDKSADSAEQDGPSRDAEKLKKKSG